MTTSILETGLSDDHVRPLIEQGREEARRRGVPVLVSATTPVVGRDALSVFERAAGRRRVLWEQPDRQFALVAVGVAEHIEGCGSERFQQIAVARRRLAERTVANQEDGGPLPAPVCLGGIAFDPLRRPGPEWRGFSDASLVVPRLLFTSHAGACRLTINLWVTPGDDGSDVIEGARFWLGGPASRDGRAETATARLTVEDGGESPELWGAAVRGALDEIRRGIVQKVVLAREVRARTASPIDAAAVLGRLRSAYENCTLFAFDHGGRTFVGATPERLVRLDGRTVHADCLAGSAPRGATLEEDEAHGAALLASAKERQEHGLVVQAFRDALAPVCSSLTVGSTPDLLRMPNVQHLHTPVEGRLADGGDVLDLVERLHPTPATGGVPRDRALALIRALEPFGRGWYAGPVGWIDGNGSGDFAVAIRSALMVGNEARLYAGCGIVADSDPDREYEESRLKLRPLLWALGGERI